MIHLQSIDGDHSHNIKEYRTFHTAEDFVTFRGNWEVTSYGSYTRPKDLGKCIHSIEHWDSDWKIEGQFRELPICSTID